MRHKFYLDSLWMIYQIFIDNLWIRIHRQINLICGNNIFNSQHMSWFLFQSRIWYSYRSCLDTKMNNKEERKYISPWNLFLKIICLYKLPPLHFSKVEVGLEWCWLNQVGNKNTASTEGNSSRIVREQHEKQHYICNLCFALHVVR